MQIWDLQKIETDRLYCSQTGPLKIWLELSGDELHLAVERIPEQESAGVASALAPAEQTQPGQMEWKRWVAGSDADIIRFQPCMPDRPVVVRPERPLRIPPGHEALFFVSIPVWVAVIVEKERPLVLEEIPSVIMSNIWFGDPMEGQLCYSLVSRARRSVDGSQPRIYRAICPVRIRNEAAEQIGIERFCVHVEHLNIYCGVSHLWTNSVNVNFYSEDLNSQIDYSPNTPDFESSARLLSQAKIPARRTVLKKSLDTFRHISGI